MTTERFAEPESPQKLMHKVLRPRLRMSFEKLVFHISLVVLFYLLLIGKADAQWVTGYTYKSKITINGAQVCGAGTHVDFPVLIQLTADFLKTTPAGLVTSPNGYDIIFTAADQTTVLSHQVDYYNSTTGTYSAWVRLPALAGAVDTDIYMYYGNAGIAADQSTQATWNADYRTVYHFENNSFTDATANALHATDNGTATVSAKIGEGRQLDGVDDFIQSTSTDLATANNFTVSVWFKANATTPGHIIWQGRGSENGWGNGVGGAQEMNVSMGTCCPGSLAQNDNISFFLGDREEQASTDGLTAETPFTNTTTWQHAVATLSNLDTSPVAKLFLNGTLIATNTGVAGPITARNLWDTPLRIGRPGIASRFFSGLVDEVRVVNTVHTDDWICTEFNNQNTPSNFIALTLHAPVLAAIEGATLNVAEDAAPVAITSAITAADWDNANAASATIQVTSNYVNGEDVLAFTDASGITGSFDASTGTLTLTGTATVADYQAALRTVTYQNTNTINPATSVRTASFRLYDGNANSAAVTRNISITPSNDPPVLAAIEGTALAFAEGQGTTFITATTTATDLDNTNLSGATIQITGNYVNTEDVLAFTAASGISGSFNAGTGTLTLSGVSSVANYQAALRAVRYNNTNNATPSTLTRTVTFRVRDAAGFGNAVTRDIAVAVVNDAPVLAAMESAALAFVEGSPSMAITANTTVGDVDNTTLTGAIVEISNNYLGSEDVLSFANAFGITGAYDAGTGTLTLTGTTTLANYESALRSVRYQNTNTGNPSIAPRTIRFRVNDGTDWSNAATRNINVSGLNDAPLLSAIEGAALAYAEGQAATAITASIVAFDVDNANLNSASIQILTGYVNGEDVLAFPGMPGISSTFNAATGTLTLSGTTSVANYQAALRLVTYRNTNNSTPSTTTRTVTFTVRDPLSNSNTVWRNITVATVNDAPQLAAMEGGIITFNEGGTPAQVTNSTTVTDVDNANITGATVQITTNFLATEDVLIYTPVPGITGTYDAATGTMTLTGSATPAIYQSAIRAISYQNTNTDNPSTLQRVVSFNATDGTDTGNTVTRRINVAGANDVPVLANIEITPLAYTEDLPAMAITSTITVTDVDNANLASATVRLTTNYVNGQDVLDFTSANGITGSFVAATGTLTLTGSATVAEYEAALRSVTYQNTNNYNPSTNTRTVVFRVYDGSANSAAVQRTITITPTNDLPILAAIETTDLAYSEDMSATVVTSSTTVVDDGTLASAVIQITGNLVNTEDILSFSNTAAITGTWNATTGTMTLTGTTTVANYQSALRSVRYRNSNSATPSTLVRTVSYTVNDGGGNSNTVTRNITVTPVNDAPTAVNDAVSVDEENTIVISPLANDTDVDNAIDPTTVTIVVGPANGTATLDATTGKITYLPNVNFTGTNFITYTMKDVAGAISNIGRINITINNINDPPSFTKGADQTVLEDAGPQLVAAWATALDDGDPFTTQNRSFAITTDNATLFESGPSISGTSGNLAFKTKGNAYGTATVTVTMRDDGSSTAPNINSSAPQTFVITVLPVNDAPVANADFYSTSSNTPVSSNAQANDSDPESNTRIYSPTPVVLPAHGTVVIQPSGTFTYTPDGSYMGTDTFTYEVCDDGTNNGVPASLCSTAQVSITVNPPNSEYNIVGNNSIQIGTHCFILTKALNNQQGAVWNRTPMDLRYSFELNFDAMFSDAGVVHDDGADGIVFTLQRDDTPPPLNTPGSPLDASGLVGEYLGIGDVSPSIGIEVDTYQNAGEPAFDHIAISKNGSVYNIVSAPVPAKEDGTGPLDIEDGQTHTVRIVWNRPTHTLEVFFDGVSRSSYTADVTNDIFNGDPTHVYWGFSSSTGGKNNYQSVCGIDMTIVNQAPVAVTDVVTVNEDAVLNGSLLTNDSDPEEGPLVASAETKATLHGSVTIYSNGTYTYTPAPDYFGADTFTYQVCDQYTTAFCSTGTVTITVDPVNDPPVAVADATSTTEDTPVTYTVLTNDTDDGNTINATTVAIVGTPAHGSAQVNSTTGEIRYTPNADYFGTDSFTYTVKDADLATSNAATVTITIAPANDAPVAIADAATIIQDVASPIRVLDNDTDIDSSFDPSTVTVVSAPAHGTTSVNTSTGVITYTPAAQYLGADVFTYTVADVEGLTSNAVTVNITVVPPNLPPVAVNDGPVIHSSVLPVAIDVLGNDSDPDNTNDELSIVSFTQPAIGTVTLEGEELVYQPSGTESGVVTFTYTIQDPDGLTSTATVTIDYTYMPLSVSQGFSPNGDNNNDYWYIRSIESFPQNSLKVFDRWGILVYQSQHYDNVSVVWNGHANTGQQAGALLDQGTYFYMLDLGNESKTLSGYVVIVR